MILKTGILPWTQLSGVSKLLHSLPANAPTKRMHAAKLVLHRCPRHAQSSRHNPLRSASGLATLYGHSVSILTYFYTLHGRSSSSAATVHRTYGSVRCARCYLSCRSCTIQTLLIRTAPLVGTRLLRRILKKG